MSRVVWVWSSGDGPIIFGTAERAKTYAASVWPDVRWVREPDGDGWVGVRPGDRESLRVYPEPVL